MKYEEPDMEVVLFDDIYTSFGLGNSSDEGGVESGFPIEEGLSL